MVTRGPRVLFESWRGRYSDSPRALSEALSAVEPAFAPVWVARPGTAMPARVKRVKRYGAKHLYQLAASDFLVTNDIVTKPVPRRTGSVYIQTWHGSPLKKVGLHEERSAYPGAEAHRRRMLRDVSRWTYLLSPSQRYTEIFRGAFGFEGEVLEIGNPRNDVLVNDDGRHRAAAREDLGLRAEDRVLLYAPTWREDCADGAGSFWQPELIDWVELDALLPPDVVILSRAHANVRHASTAPPTGRVRDVSGVGDVAELLLAADGLITDYSSIVHDFAVTGRPIYLHAPDLDRYRDRVRELYFDYEEWAPGPVSSSTVELADNITRSTAADAEDRAAFLKDYCTFEDGRATRRLVDIILSRSGPAS